MAEDTRRSQRNRVTGHDQSGVTVGTARPNLIAFENGNRVALRGKVIRRADTDHAATDNENIFTLIHVNCPIDLKSQSIRRWDSPLDQISPGCKVALP